jgi:DNA polymerase epsilon subunit 2
VFRKFSNSLGPDTLVLVEEILNHHEIEDDDVESSLETLAKEYNKQDGTCQVLFFLAFYTDNSCLDATMKVSVNVLKRVYESLQNQGERSEIEKEIIDPENHLFFIDAFEMPRWTWSPERGTFEMYVIIVRLSVCDL